MNELRTAVQAGDISMVLSLIEMSNMPSEFAWEAVSHAISLDREHVIDSLLPKLVPKKTAYPLVYAAKRGMASVVQKLIPLSDPTPAGEQSLVLANAAKSGSIETVLALLPVTDPLADDSEALEEAAKAGHADIVRLLIPLSDPKARQSSALSAAARSGHAGVVKLLLPVSSSIICATQVFPTVAALGHIPVLKVLLRARLPDAGDTYTLGLDLAARDGQASVVDLLIPAIERAGRPRGCGLNAICEAAKAGHIDVVKRLISFVSRTDCSVALSYAFTKGKEAVFVALLPHADAMEAESHIYGMESKAAFRRELDRIAAEAQCSALEMTTPRAISKDIKRRQRL
ncbi:TPA: ankyrin repeat domain-containing protein [Stenotrophomonas maltophilia]